MWIAALILAGPPAVEDALCAGRGEVVVLRTERDLLQGLHGQTVERRVYYPDGLYRAAPSPGGPGAVERPLPGTAAPERHASLLSAQRAAALTWCESRDLTAVEPLGIATSAGCTFAECRPGERASAGVFALGDERVEVVLEAPSEAPLSDTLISLLVEGRPPVVVARWSPLEYELNRGRRARLDPTRLRSAFLAADGLTLGLVLDTVVPVHGELGSERRAVLVPLTALSDLLGVNG